MFQLHALLFRLMVVIVYQSFIACYNARQKQVKVQLHDVPIFTSYLTSTILRFLVNHSWDPSCSDFCHQQCSSKIVLLLIKPVRMPTESAISCTLSRRFCSTMFSTARQFSWQTASDGRSDWDSFRRFLLPRGNSAAQCLTMAYDSASSP